MSDNDESFFRRNGDFLLLWAGQVGSQSGGRMFQIAMIWWLLDHASGGAGKLVGGFMVMAALPPLLLVRVIGHSVDRYPAKRILIAGDLAAAAMLLLAAVGLAAGLLTVPAAFGIGFVAATLQAFLDPTLNKAVGDVVSSKDVERAVGLLASTQSLANFAGAVLGAMLIASLGVAGTAILGAIAYVLSSTATAVARFRYAVPRTPSSTEAVKGAWALLDEYPLVKRCLIGFGFINFFMTPTLVVLPLYVKKTLGGNASTLGALEAALWVGLLGGAFLGGMIPSRDRLRLGAFCLAIMGACLAVPGFVTSVGVYGAALCIAGLALGVNNVKFVALFQETVDPAIKGRFFALMSAVVGFSFPIAYFFFGALTDLLSPPLVCLVQGTGVLVMAGYFLLLSRTQTQSPVAVPA